MKATDMPKAYCGTGRTNRKTQCATCGAGVLTTSPAGMESHCMACRRAKHACCQECGKRTRGRRMDPFVCKPCRRATRVEVGYTTTHGYKRSHTMAYVHREIAEKALGHALPAGAQVHHLNGNKADNRHGNLVVCENHAYHMLLHHRQRALLESGSPNNMQCKHCKQWDNPMNMTVLSTRSSVAYHKRCHTQAARKYWGVRLAA